MKARTSRNQHDLVECVRGACVEAALTAYEDASIRGLCREGAWEVAIDSIRSLDLTSIEARSIKAQKKT